MATPKSIAAQTRTLLRKAADLRNREAVANLGAAAVVTGTAANFADYDFTLGYTLLVAKMSSAKRAKCTDIGRDFRLGLVPTTTAEVGVDLIVRLPADHPDASAIVTMLQPLGLKVNRKRAGLNYMECVGVSDEAVVRAIVEPVGGTVTAIMSPTVISGETSGSDGRVEVSADEAHVTVEDEAPPREDEAEQEPAEEAWAVDDAALPAADRSLVAITVTNEAAVEAETASREVEADEGAVGETRETDLAATLTTDEADATIRLANEAAVGRDRASETDELPREVMPEASDTASALEKRDDPATASTAVGPLGVPVNPASSWPMRSAASPTFHARMRPAPTVRPLGDIHPGRDTSDGEQAGQENLG